MDEPHVPAAPAITLTRKKPRLFYGWYIVAGSFFTHWLGAGIGVPTFGQFFKPMSEDLGWSRSLTTLPLVLRTVLSQLISPFIGPLVDKYGPRYLMTVGAIIAGIGTMLMSQVHSLWQFALYFAVIGAIGNAGLSNIVTNTTLAKWFVRMRGRAVGIAATGINAGEAVMTPLVAVLLYGITLHFSWQVDFVIHIPALGWRGAWIVLGLLPWVIVTPTAWLWMRRAPEDMGLRPDGDPPTDARVAKGSPGARASAAEQEHSWSPKAAFKTPALWLIIISVNLASLGVSGVVLHQIPYMTDRGLSGGIAALSLTTYALCAIPSKLVWGFLSERIHIRYLTAASMLGSAVGILILLRTDTIAEAILFGVVYGSTRGAWAVVSSLIWANYFGRNFLGAIRGYTAPLQLGSAIGGPLFASYMYDTTHSYTLAFSVFFITFALGGILVLMARPPRAPQHAEGAAPPVPARV